MHSGVVRGGGVRLGYAGYANLPRHQHLHQTLDVDRVPHSAARTARFSGDGVEADRAGLDGGTLEPLSRQGECDHGQGGGGSEVTGHDTCCPLIIESCLMDTVYTL